MYFVGIDISKFKHDCAVINEIGDTILPSWSFSNDCEGFSLPRERLRGLEDEGKASIPTLFLPDFNKQRPDPFRSPAVAE